MCLILFAWLTHPRYRLVVAANRDEFYTRATDPLAWWDESERRIAAGRDRAAGGTWMGVSADARFAALTNVRQGSQTGVTPPGLRSRGELAVRFLSADQPAPAAAATIHDNGGEYQGFNLLIADAEQMWWTSNRSAAAPHEISPGLHGISNAALDTPWPKVTGGLADFGGVCRDDDGSPAVTERYFAILADTARAPWKQLPHTGVPRLSERRLSARFVDMGDYGTRASTVLRVAYDGSFDVAERRFGRRGTPCGASELTLPPRRSR